jgi:hypothetical protein
MGFDKICMAESFRNVRCVMRTRNALSSIHVRPRALCYVADLSQRDYGTTRIPKVKSCKHHDNHEASRLERHEFTQPLFSSSTL